jgi:hypothetical protein
MPAINWAFLCDYAYVDASGKASIIGMFENIFVRHLPARHPQIYIAISTIIGKNENFKIGLILSSPSGKEVAKIPQHDITPPPNAQDNKVVFAFGFFNTEFTETGEHSFEIFIGDTCVHSIPFTITLRK